MENAKDFPRIFWHWWICLHLGRPKPLKGWGFKNIFGCWVIQTFYKLILQAFWRKSGINPKTDSKSFDSQNRSNQGNTYPTDHVMKATDLAKVSYHNEVPLRETCSRTTGVRVPIWELRLWSLKNCRIYSFGSSGVPVVSGSPFTAGCLLLGSSGEFLIHGFMNAAPHLLSIPQTSKP